MFNFTLIFFSGGKPVTVLTSIAGSATHGGKTVQLVNTVSSQPTSNHGQLVTAGGQQVVVGSSAGGGQQMVVMSAAGIGNQPTASVTGIETS